MEAVVQASPLGGRIGNIDIDPEDADDGFLRVILRLDNLDHVDTAEALRLSQRIRDALSDQDDRFPSVRFAEAA